MTLKEYVEMKPITKKRILTFRRVMLETFLVCIQTFLPFVSGYYFFSTQNILFMLPVLFVIVFNVTIKEEEVL